MSQMKDDALKDLLRECSAHITEKSQEIYSLLPGVGDSDSNVMVVTTYPGAKEEASGNYFEGNAGKNYEKFLSAFDGDREMIYSTYAVKYRPYKISEKSGRIVNRVVSPEEVTMFQSYLMDEIALVKPKTLITMGELAYQAVIMDFEAVPPYGDILIQRAGGIDCQLIPMPHPGEAGFNKVGVTEDMITVLRNSLMTPKVKPTPLREPESVQAPSAQPEINIKPVIQQVTQSPEPAVIRSKKPVDGKHKVILVCGGSHLANDPSFVVAERVSNVLAELNMGITRIDLYKGDYHIDDFLAALEEASGVILATTVEWLGMGGLMQTFLDRAYMSRQFPLFEGTYLFNIAISRNRFEREAMNQMLMAWELLGGLEGINLCAAIESSADIETSKEMLQAIDKKAEDFYRIVHQQRVTLPSSIHSNKIVLNVPREAPAAPMDFSMTKPMKTVQVRDDVKDTRDSVINNYDEFIEKQQKDIDDIASLFKVKLSETGGAVQSIPKIFQHRYKPDGSFGDCTVSWLVTDDPNQNFSMTFSGGQMTTSNGRHKDAEVFISLSMDTLKKITDNKLTIQKAFMTGEIKAKGSFALLYQMDALFAF